MAKRFTYEWPRPAVTVDCAVFTVTGENAALRLETLLISRKLEPFAGKWALPGGFVHEHEALEAAAHRELVEETGIANPFLEQVVAVGTKGRDPRGHVVTILYVALVSADLALHPGTDAAAAQWFATDALPALAFDHEQLLAAALAHLRRNLGTSPVCFELLPKEFTLSELQALYEAILGEPVDRRNFRRKVIEDGVVRPAQGKFRLGTHRPAQLYRRAKI